MININSDNWQRMGSLADILLSEPGAVEDRFREAILSKSENGWYEMDALLPHFKKGRRVLISAGALVDETGAVKGVLQMVREFPARLWTGL